MQVLVCDDKYFVSVILRGVNYTKVYIDLLLHWSFRNFLLLFFILVGIFLLGCFISIKVGDTFSHILLVVVVEVHLISVNSD